MLCQPLHTPKGTRRVHAVKYLFSTQTITFGFAPLSNRGEHVYYSTLREKMNDLYYCFSQDKNQLLSKKILINNQKSINIKNKHRVSMRTPYSETHTELSTNGYNAWR